MDIAEQAASVPKAVHGVVLCLRKRLGAGKDDDDGNASFAVVRGLVLDGDLAVKYQPGASSWRGHSPTNQASVLGTYEGKADAVVPNTGSSSDIHGVLPAPPITGGTSQCLPTNPALSTTSSISLDAKDVPSDAAHRCLLLGLPHSVTRIELSSFIEPYENAIRHFHILHTHTGSADSAAITASASMIASTGIASTSEVVRVEAEVEAEVEAVGTLTVLPSVCAVLDFYTAAMAHNFVQLYNNLHFPVSASSSADSVVGKVNIPILAIALAWVRGVDSLPIVISPSSTSISTSTELPLCSVCIRRLDPSYSGVPGAEEIPVSLKFADNCDACSTCAIYGAYVQHDDECEDEKYASVALAQMQRGVVSRDGIITPSSTPPPASMSASTAGAMGTEGTSTSTASTSTASIGSIHANASTNRNRNGSSETEAQARAAQQHLRLEARKTLPWVCTGNNNHGHPCDLAENIWVCMVCAHTGCGRYANQHAKQHGQATGHTFSLEMVSGRIWAYRWDTFVHADGLLYEELQTDDFLNLARTQRYGSVPRAGEATGENGEDSNRGAVAGNLSPGKRQCASAVGSSGTWSFRNSTGESDTTAAIIGGTGNSDAILSLRSRRPRHSSNFMETSPSLPHDVVNKMHSVTHEYEELLESQLVEQQLFYEKKLARETVQALERAYTGPRSTSDSNEVSSSVSSSSSSSSSALQTQVDLNNDVLHSEDTQEIFSEIERQKIITSLVEQEHQQLLSELRETELLTRQTKKENDAVIRRLKGLKQADIDTRQRAKQLEQRFREQEEELKQTIRDLGFFLDTRGTIGRSDTSTKDELARGSIIEIADPPPAPAPKTESDAGVGRSRESGKMRK